MTQKASSLASVSQTRAVLERHGLMTKKALGQHFLINDGVVARICSLAGLCDIDKVVEVGPGIGTLTLALLQRAGEVVSIERDSDLPPVLAETCAPWQERFTLIEGDALEVLPEEVPFAPNKLVANLPYAVAATIVLDYFERFASLESQTIMVQAEVADRMSARVGTKNYGAYTVKLALFSEVAGRFSVSENNFFPPPRVKSAVIRLNRRSIAEDLDTCHAAMVMADAGFATRRKTIANSMRTYFTNAQIAQVPLAAKEHTADFVAALLEKAGCDSRVRAESLEPEAFLVLGKAYRELF